MASTAEEFRKRARKRIKLPSGMEVEIRKVWATFFHDLVHSPESDTESDSIKFATRMIVQGSVQPKFTDREEDNPGAVHVRDLSIDDYSVLVKEIGVWSGLIAEDPGDPSEGPPPSTGSQGSE